MSNVRQYIGARYVPLIDGEWDNTKTYEPLTVVYYNGNSYTSRQHVPTGIDISNTDYWAQSGNYNAQIEAYRQEVWAFDDRIDALEADGSVTTQKIADGAVTNAKIADGAITLGKMSAGNIRNMWSYSMQFYNKNVVFFGDSYLAPNIENSEHEWLAQKLESELQMHRFNYAYGGAGFGRPTNLIKTQQDICDGISTRSGYTPMTSDEKTDTALVICMAGCNDLLNITSQNITQSMITTGINDFIAWANTTFPNARIVLIPFNWGYNHLTSSLLQMITNCMNSINSADHKKGCTIVPGSWLWNLGIRARFRNAVHPNTAGLQVILNHILNAIMGQDDNTFGVASSITFNSAALRSYVCNYNVINGIVYVNGYLRPDEAQIGVGNQIEIGGSAESPLLPAIVTPNGSIHTIPLTSSSSGKSVGFLLFRANATAVCKFVDVAENEVCCFNYSYLAEVGKEF